MHRLLLVPTVVEARLLLGDASAGALAEAAGTPRLVALGDARVFAAVCGFGLAAAGAGAGRAAEGMLEHGGVRELWLAGVAGSYDAARAPIGAAIVGETVTCWGIGVGEGAAHQSAAALGWHQAWDHAASMDVGAPSAREQIRLAHASIHGVARGELISVTAASASADEAARRRRANPAALAEDMESFAVALAARLRAVPLTVVRGISNVAGDRDKRSWRMAEALVSARRLLVSLFADAPLKVRS